MEVQTQRQAHLQQKEKPHRFPAVTTPEAMQAEHNSSSKAKKIEQVRNKNSQQAGVVKPTEEENRQCESRAVYLPNCCKTAKFFGNGLFESSLVPGEAETRSQSSALWSPNKRCSPSYKQQVIARASRMKNNSPR